MRKIGDWWYAQMNCQLIKRILYLYRVYCGRATYFLYFNDGENKECYHMFTIKNNYIGYSYLMGGEESIGFDCTDILNAELPHTDMKPNRIIRETYSFDDNSIYSREQLIFRYEIEILTKLFIAMKDNCSFAIKYNGNIIEFNYMYGRLYFTAYTEQALTLNAISLYDLGKLHFPNYELYWVYGKCSYPKLTSYIRALEGFAESKGLYFSTEYSK